MISISDEGNNGLVLHVVNEAAHVLEVTLFVFTLYRAAGETIVAQGRRDLRVDGRGTLELSAAEIARWVQRPCLTPTASDPRPMMWAIATLARADFPPFAQATYCPAGLAVRETRDIRGSPRWRCGTMGVTR
jgi:hypothetical protein